MACWDWSIGDSWVGPFITAGPIMAALSGAAIGATAGGITGALIGMGIPEVKAKVHEGKNVLILDLAMPRLNGIEVLKRLNQVSRAPPIGRARARRMAGLSLLTPDP